MDNLEKCSDLYQQKYYEFLYFFQTSTASERSDLVLHSEITLLPEFWDKEIENMEISENLMDRALFDFYSLKFCKTRRYYLTDSLKKRPFDKSLNNNEFCETRTGISNFCFYEILGRKNCKSKLVEFLSFPHAKLKEVFESFEEYSGAFTTPKICHLYQISQTVFEKITNANDDVRKWFKYLLESQDDRFIIQNVEERIAEEPTNKDLWKPYIQFLKDKNEEAAYEVYYRYNRFFLNNEETFGFSKNSEVPILRDGRYMEKAKYDPVRKEFPWIKNRPSSICFKYVNISPQTFPFRASLMNYIIKNAKPEILQQLYQSCKYFFAKIQKPLCHTFMIHDACKTTYYQNSFMMNKENVINNDDDRIGRMFICNVIFVKTETYLMKNEQQKLIFSNIIPKIKLQNLRILRIVYQIISTSDYEFLTESGNIEKIIFEGKILDSQKNPISLEKIFKPLSKAFDIEFRTTVTINPNSWKILASYKKAVKSNFIYFPNCEIDYFDFIEYLLHNCADDSHVVYPDSANGLEMENGIRCVVEYAKEEKIKNFPKIDLCNYYFGMPRFDLFESYL